MPLTAGNHMPFEIEGQPSANQDNRPKASIFNASDGYFETLGIRVSRGRAIDAHDTGGSEDVAMVNEEFVRRYLPGRDPLGAIISPEQMTAKGILSRKRRIVGVFATIKRGRVSDWPEPEIAVPNGQGSGGSSISVRVSGDPAEFRAPILQALKTIGAMTRGMKPETLDQMASNLVVRERGYAIVFGALAGLALLLSAVGIYGVMSFMVAQRTREIGVRMALGATPRLVVELIFKEGMLLAVVGMVVGLLGASSVSSAFQAVLFDARVLPYGAFGAAAVVLLLCAAGACGLPAYRASEVDPVTSLRAE
jgi:putative ABC transport system permease protein